MSQLEEETGRGRRRWLWLRRPVWIFVAAFALRAAMVGVLLAHNPMPWGVNEPGGIARALVQGRGFASPFHDSNGPTAWLAPVYPILLAGIFLLFGIETPAAAIVAMLINAIVAALTALTVVRLGRDHFGETAGLVAGWAWALAPPLVTIPWLLWDTCLSGLVLALVVLVTLRLGPTSRLPDWAWCGALWSLAALLNPMILAPLPALVIEAAVRSRRWKGAVVMVAVCVLGLAPWTARNYGAFGQVFPVRSNFWPEVYFGNVDFSAHPIGHSMLYQREGEIHYANDLRARALSFIRANPGTFARLTAQRVVAYWVRPPQWQPYPLLLFLIAMGGIVQAWRRREAWLGFAAVLLFYPLGYYVSYAFSRYRYPVEPLMYVLAGYCLCELLENRKLPVRPSSPG